MGLRFLIDENLADTLTRIAHQRCHEAIYVPHVGLPRASDELLFQRALEGEWILVTNNAGDFLALLRRFIARDPANAIHPGMILVITQANSTVQERLFEEALTFLKGRLDLINAVIHLDVDDDTKKRLQPNQKLSPAEWAEITKGVRPVVRIEAIPPQS